MRDYGLKISGAVPYEESRKMLPTFPRPFTRLETRVNAGFKFVVLLGANYIYPNLDCPAVVLPSSVYLKLNKEAGEL